MGLLHQAKTESGSLWPARWRRVFELEPSESDWLCLEEVPGDGVVVVRALIDDGGSPPGLDVRVAGGVLYVHARLRPRRSGSWEAPELIGQATLPPGAVGEAARATYGSGLLEVVVPCREAGEDDTVKVPVVRVEGHGHVVEEPGRRGGAERGATS